MKRLALPVLVLGCFCVLPFVAVAQRSAVASLQQVSTGKDSTMRSDQSQSQATELHGDIFMAQKMYPQAISTYKSLVKGDPHNAELLNKLGIAYEGNHNDGSAERAFKLAIKADKKYADAYNNIGTVEYDRHKYSHAIDWYQKSLSLRTDVAPVYYNLGCAYFDSKKYSQAMDSFRRAIQIDPGVMNSHGRSGSIVQPRGTTDMGSFYFLLARMYAQLGNAERAAHYLTMSRDDGYKKFDSARTDPSFALVVKDPRVQAVFQPVPGLLPKH
ncbi:MAG TPA: tetratricopeptide repeat protein [Candidatus Acidoferrales bacterium]|nr:tetratricopeptide repeat protein [Candidatus Acidoferrales bacterium]